MRTQLASLRWGPGLIMCGWWAHSPGLLSVPSGYKVWPGGDWGARRPFVQ